MKSKFHKSLKARKKTSKRKCECWDCLRQEGLTPPRSALHKHKPLYGDLPEENPYVTKT